MDVAAVCERVRCVAATRDAVAAGSADRGQLESGLQAIAVVRSWLAAAEAELAACLATVVSFPEQAMAQASRGSQGEAGRVLERAATLGETPRLAHALNDGSVTPSHIDAITRAAMGLEGGQRAELRRRADRLAAFAAVASVADWRKRLALEVRALQAGDGMAAVERQRASMRLRRWLDGDGMWCLFGRFDPLTGVRLSARLDAEIEAMFAQSVPAGCPTDPVAKHQYLAAQALVAILLDGGTAQRSGRPEFVVVVEAEAEADGHPRPGAAGPSIDWGLPVEVPHRVLADLFGEADVHVVIVRNGVVLHAPGVLDLGRSTRLANRAQRRALRALYATCAIPGCRVGFERCKIHHVHWWHRGGPTDLDNLTCS